MSLRERLGKTPARHVGANSGRSRLRTSARAPGRTSRESCTTR
jgi:hypothetical protein